MSRVPSEEGAVRGAINMKNMKRSKFEGMKAGGMNGYVQHEAKRAEAKYKLQWRHQLNLCWKRNILAIFAINWQFSYLLFASLSFKLLLVNVGAIPSSYCYVLDKHNHIYDFTSLAGKKFEYEGKGSDLIIRFCKDLQNRSNLGYIDFGHFAPLNYFAAGNGKADFVQEYYYGDLRGCEFYGHDKMGRTAEVNMFCGNCTNGAICKDKSGCICSVSYGIANCRVIVDLALSCGQPGPRIFQGFTAGFHPRAWEVVYNGITQWGYEKPHYEFSFGTEQTKVSLYFTAVASLSQHVRKPYYKVFPEKGLEIMLTGSASMGDPPTTLSPTILDVNWRCEKVQDTPYEVNITIPIEGYHPIEFSLGKLCEYKQVLRNDSTKGWATFGVLCCILIVLSTASCCAGFLYKTRVEHRYGLDALPGMSFLSACLEIASGASSSYRPANDINSSIISQSTWERPVTGPVSRRASDSKYGSV